jgi:hypothetical protein
MWRELWKASGWLFAEQAARSVESILKAILEGGIVPAAIDMLGDCRTDYFRDGARLHVSNGFQRFCLLSRQTNGHGFDWFHGVNMDY